MNFRKILIAIDESPFAAHAADAGLTLAAQLGAEVAFVTVVEPNSTTWNPASDVVADESLSLLKHDARTLLTTFAARKPLAPPPLEFMEIGRPASRICEAATTWQADLIVVGTHGRTALASVFLGSVAQEVLRDARCPVMVVRAPHS